ncbi:hypothetical protein [Prescottella agglutinans]|uniref:Transcriptional regulator, AbiEi antitoxin, Type IV TA system n=1 Tax=Prescottella agglutinans TaxID=1644129 RepID=A0ABT6MCV3_9NOCA|nr:hypothetical protein [Prescottella agglutinans]MDH6282127.1 hypothetical protein [Prescottella agglutinans]
MEFDGTPLVFRAEALEHGFTDHELRTARRSRELLAVRPGAYVRATDLARLDAVAQHRLAVLATASACRDAVVSHVSAAVMHGIELWNVPLRLVHSTLDRPSGGKVTNRRHVHVGRLPAEDVVVVDGLTVTTPARTVVDLARTVPFECSVVSGDHALAMGLVTHRDLTDALEQCRGRRGAAQAARAVAFMDARSESVGESRSRVLIHRMRLPVPDLQRVLHDDGVQLGRVDFFFERERVVGEFDGLGKYTEHLRPGQTTEQAVIEEKTREDRIRAAGYSVARWGWRELSTPEEVVRRLRRAFD